MQPDGNFFDVVAIASASGGLSAIAKVVSDLPEDFPASIMIVHRPDHENKIHLADLIGRYTKLPAKEAEEGEKLAKSTIYTSMPDKHMMVNSDGTITFTSRGLVHFTRPAADVLLVSLAISCRNRAIAVILTGAGQDGALGALAIKRAGGKTIAQEDPQVPGMPEAAIIIDHVDYIVPLADIASLLVDLVTKGKSE